MSFVGDLLRGGARELNNIVKAGAGIDLKIPASDYVDNPLRPLEDNSNPLASPDSAPSIKEILNSLVNIGNQGVGVKSSTFTNFFLWLFGALVLFFGLKVIVNFLNKRLK